MKAKNSVFLWLGVGLDKNRYRLLKPSFSSQLISYLLTKHSSAGSWNARGAINPVQRTVSYHYYNLNKISSRRNV